MTGNPRRSILLRDPRFEVRSLLIKALSLPESDAMRCCSREGIVSQAMICIPRNIFQSPKKSVSCSFQSKSSISIDQSISCGGSLAVGVAMP